MKIPPLIHSMQLIRYARDAAAWLETDFWAAQVGTMQTTVLAVLRRTRGFGTFKSQDHSTGLILKVMFARSYLQQILVLSSRAPTTTWKKQYQISCTVKATRHIRTQKRSSSLTLKMGQSFQDINAQHCHERMRSTIFLKRYMCFLQGDSILLVHVFSSNARMASSQLVLSPWHGSGQPSFEAQATRHLAHRPPITSLDFWNFIMRAAQFG